MILLNKFCRTLGLIGPLISIPMLLLLVLFHYYPASLLCKVSLELAAAFAGAGWILRGVDKPGECHWCPLESLSAAACFCLVFALLFLKAVPA